jgi:hypothetical protein
MASNSMLQEDLDACVSLLPQTSAAQP